jgi:hypothetical protein
LSERRATYALLSAVRMFDILTTKGDAPIADFPMDSQSYLNYNFYVRKSDIGAQQITTPPLIPYS